MSPALNLSPDAPEPEDQTSSDFIRFVKLRYPSVLALSPFTTLCHAIFCSYIYACMVYDVLSLLPTYIMTRTYGLLAFFLSAPSPEALKPEPRNPRLSSSDPAKYHGFLFQRWNKQPQHLVFSSWFRRFFLLFSLLIEINGRNILQALSSKPSDPRLSSPGQK